MRKLKPGITCVTLSAQAHQFDALPKNITYLNRVQTFKHIKDYYEHWIHAVQTVETEVFFVQDYDDPLPNFYPSKVDGLYHGDYIEISNHKAKRISALNYSKRQHIDTPAIIHKAFCNTRAVHMVLEHLPQNGFVLPEGMVYYPLVHCFGRQYDKTLEMPWLNHSGGLHHKNGPRAIENTRNFLRRQGEVICCRVAQSQERDRYGYPKQETD